MQRQLGYVTFATFKFNFLSLSYFMVEKMGQFVAGAGRPFLWKCCAQKNMAPNLSGIVIVINLQCVFCLVILQPKLFTLVLPHMSPYTREGAWRILPQVKGRVDITFTQSISPFLTMAFVVPDHISNDVRMQKMYVWNH